MAFGTFLVRFQKIVFFQNFGGPFLPSQGAVPIGTRESIHGRQVVRLEGVVVAGTERGSRLDHLRHATRVRNREPLAPVGDERLLVLLTALIFLAKI